MAERVLVVSTGGTIASTTDAGGASPTESGTDIVGDAPDLRDRILIEDLAQRSSSDVDFPLLERLRERVADHAADSDAGVVVTHGTDTMAESAYYLDLVRDEGPPVVFTGAQRRADQPGADGPANLRTAVDAAEQARLREAGGVYVCFDGELHAARDVVKAHTWRLGAFASPGKGPAATLGPAGFERHRELGSHSVTIPTDGSPGGKVAVVTTGIEVGRESVDRAVDADVDGVVLQATGLGNAPVPVAEAVADAVDAGVPVVVTSRCHVGGVATVYGGGGGGYTLQEHGAVFAGDLPAWKARLKLLVALEAGVDPADSFDERASDD